MDKQWKIAVAGMGYVGLSNAVLLAQHNDVVAVDLIEEKVAMVVLVNQLLSHGVEETIARMTSLLCQRIDFDNRPVDVVGQPLPLPADLCHGC